MKLKQLLPQNLLIERYVTLIKPEDRNKYASLVWDMLQQTYAKLGGFKSAKDSNELIDETNLWKLVRKNGKIVAVSFIKTNLVESV